MKTLRHFTLRWLCLLLSCSGVIANANHHNLEKPQKHASYGTHGMAVFQLNNRLFASHMPLANSIHAHQVILEIELLKKDLAQKTLAALKQGLVSLQPEPFALRDLQNGKIVQFKAHLLNGHFERGGKPFAKYLKVRVKSILLDLPLTAKNNGSYQLVSTQAGHLLVHRVAKSPSFDHIIEVYVGGTPKQTSFATQSSQPLSNNHWPELLSRQGIQFKRQLYLEVNDFQ